MVCLQGGQVMLVTYLTVLTAAKATDSATEQIGMFLSVNV